MILYADTSALVKLVVPEVGATGMRAAVQAAHRVVSAAIAYVELHAAVSAAERAGRLAPVHQDDVTVHVDMVWDGVIEIPVDHTLIRRAAGLAHAHRLRAHDAVHLAALLRTGTPNDVSFACWDEDLCRAAVALGFARIDD